MNSSPFFAILDIFIFLGALGLADQAVIGLSFFISSVWKRSSVQPFSLRCNSSPHRFIVWLITRNKYARRIFSVMNDIFYGRITKTKVAPKWARFNPS